MANFHTSASFSGHHNQGFELGINSGHITNYFGVHTGFPQKLGLNPPRESFSTTPFSLDPHFVPRGDILDQIHERCSQAAARVALVGLGGVGKSQVAIQYSYQVRERYPHTWVFWVHGSNEARFEQSYKVIADRLGLLGRNDPQANVLQLVTNWLCDESNGRWVMIVDNADDADTFFSQPTREPVGRVKRQCTIPPSLASFLPQSQNGSILFTSRSEHVAARLTGGYTYIIKLEAMAQDEGLSLLGKKMSIPCDETDAASELLEGLDYMPLAITQAAAFINRLGPRGSIAKYLVYFHKSDKSKANLLNKDEGDLRRDSSASNSIITTWQISFDHMREERPSAADLLSLMSFFDRQGIPEFVLRGYTNKMGAYVDTDLNLNTITGTNQDPDVIADTGLGPDTDADADLDLDTSTGTNPDPNIGADTDLDLDINGDADLKLDTITGANLDSGVDADTDPDLGTDANADLDLEFEEDLATLRGYCLIASDMEGRTFEMHRLVQFAMKRWLEAFGQLDVWRRNFLRTLFTKCPKPRLEQWSTWEVLLPHAEAAELDEPEDEESLQIWSDVLDRAASHEYLRGRYYTAERTVRKAISARQRARGNRSPGTLRSMNLLASILLGLGRYDLAEEVSQRVLDESGKALGKDHYHTLLGMQNLAATYAHQGRYEAAEKLSRLSLDGVEKTLGRDHDRVSRSMEILARIFSGQGDFGAAENIHRQVLYRREKVLGKEHPSLLQSMSALARTLSDQNKHEEAEKMIQTVVIKQKKILGEDHPDTWVSMRRLAIILANQGKYEAAEKMTRQLLDKYEKMLGNDHPSTLWAVWGLASMLYNQRKYNSALELYERACGGLRKVHGEDHPWTINCEKGYSSLLKKLNE